VTPRGMACSTRPLELFAEAARRVVPADAAIADTRGPVWWR
jgi:hypothetical protein